VAHVVADAEPALMIVDPGLTVPAGVVALTLDEAGGGTLWGAGDDVGAPGVGDLDLGDPPHRAPQPDDVAVLLYTSGTTGRPKGAPLTQGNLGANAQTLRRAWGFTGEDWVAHALPVYHAHGLLVAVNISLANGTPMLWFDRFDPASLLEAAGRWTVFMGVPTHYVRLLAEPRCTPAVVGGVRLWLSGSAPLLATTHDEWERRTGQRILERYGMTETVMLTSNPLVGERRAGSVGLPLDGVDVRLDMRDGDVRDGAAGIGEIQVRGPNVFGGYWRRPDLEEATFAPGGWFRTGDLGEFDPDGYLRIVGRAKDLVISGGLNVYPKEVETVLDSLPGVAESAVVGLADLDLGEVVTALVVATPGVDLDTEALRAAARGQLAGYKVPRRIEVVDELPRNAMGKVEKATIRRMLSLSDTRAGVGE
jgi:malonyl-CoA/methylmalonyl-CoA synthetase